MRTAHLFAGAGGGILADLILGHTPVLAVEWEESCCNSLRDRSEEGWFPLLWVHHGDVRDFDFTPWRGGVDCVVAGFPCQDISAAGPGGGLSGERSGLVSEVFRAIDELNPAYVFLENSPNIRTRGRREVIAQLVARGYSWRDGKIAAADVGAPHKRERWFLLATNIDQERRDRRSGVEREANRRYELEDGVKSAANTSRNRCEQGRAECPRQQREVQSEWSCSSSANTLRQRLQRGGLSEAESETIQAAARYTGAYNWSPPDLGVCRVVDGVASRVDRIKACGNGQVPLQAAAAWLILSGDNK